MKRTALLCSVGVFLLLAGQLLADIPKQMNYQGILSGSTGNPLADSTVDVEFRIYNAPAGGSSVWAETVTVTTDGEGRFNVILGLISPIEDTVFGGTERYLSINVESSGEIVPRTKLTSVGYANRVGTVDGASGGGIIGHTTIYGSGLDDLIALGVSDPNVALELRSGTTGGSPYMDFANDAVSDFDARIQQNGEKGLKVLTDSSFAVPFGKVGFGTLSPGSMSGLTNSRVEIADEDGLLSDFTLRVAGPGGSSAQNFAKSRGTLNTPSVVSDGDLLGNLLFVGYDGLDFGSFAAWIRAAVDGTPGINDMPGRLQFMTTPDGFESPIVRMTIKNDGKVGVGTTTPNAKFEVLNSISSSSSETGVNGLTSNSSTGSAFGGIFTASSAGSGVHTGVRGNASSTSANSAYGVYGEADNSSTGEAFGGYFNVPTSGGTGAVYGVMANAFGTIGASSPVYGGYFFTDGSGGGTNYGVYATAPTSAGFAGYFAGNARVSDTLFASNVSSLSPLRLQTAGTTRMHIDDVTGNVGIGNQNPTSGRLVVQGGNLVVARPELGNQPSLNVVPGYGGSTGVAIVAAGNLAATHLYLQPSNGNVGIGTTNPTNPLQMASGAHVTAGGTWTNASSKELKTDIVPLKDEEYFKILEKLEELKVVHFKYKSEPDVSHIGMIAEEVPEEIASPDKRGIPTADAIAFLMAAVKAQQEKIVRLEKRLKEVEKN